MKWLINLCAQSRGQKLHIIIVDYHTLDIPWEILALENDKYLGAMAAITRWRRIQYFSEFTELHIKDTLCHNATAYYLDDDLGQDAIYTERILLERLQSKAFPHLENIEQYLLSLNTSDGIGLIYLGCHGYDGQAIGSQRERFQRIDALHLERCHQLVGTRPLIFVNACDSACLNERGYGLLDVALARFASGYMGSQHFLPPKSPLRTSGSVVLQKFPLSVGHLPSAM